MNLNTSSDITLDVRTPPKVKQHIKKPPKKNENLENSHPGIAVPIEDSELVLEQSTKKNNFYKINKSTTDSGLSTWVLLNSQTVSPPSVTIKPSRKSAVKQKGEVNKNSTNIDVEIFNKIAKPLFKKRVPVSTTKKHQTTTTSVHSMSTEKVTTLSDKDQKLTKIKASILKNAMNKKNNATLTTSTKKPLDVSTAPTNINKESLQSHKNKFETSTNSNDIPLLSTTSMENAILSIESKQDDIELEGTTTSSKKTRRPSTKRKKNKNRRRKPATDKSDLNNTKVANKVVNHKDKPFSTQIYNYLSREIMPTVGVGLVGLMVTAGLASYFLYPFGVARRSYEVDRRDKDGAYYYNEEYTPGGISEEEAIGKVIAGMPSLNHRSRDTYSSLRYNDNEQGYKKEYQQGPEESIYLTPDNEYNTYSSQKNRKPNYYGSHAYDKDIIERSQETGYTVNNQFVVGNVPKELQDVTLSVVPEHGPRNLPKTESYVEIQDMPNIVGRSLPYIPKIRKRRNSDIDNEISTDEEFLREETSTIPIPSTIPPDVTTISSTSNSKPESLIQFFRNVLETKIKYGLEILQSASKSISRYFAEVNRRFNDKMQSKEQPRIF